MSYTDLRDFISKVETPGVFHRIDGADPRYEIGGITEVAAGLPAMSEYQLARRAGKGKRMNSPVSWQRWSRRRHKYSSNFPRYTATKSHGRFARMNAGTISLAEFFASENVNAIKATA